MGGGKEEWGKARREKRKGRKWWKTLFLRLEEPGKMRKRKERETEREGGKCWWSGERARGREGERGLPGAAIGPSAVMPGAEKPARRPLMEAGMLKLRVVVSTPSPGTAVRPLPLELSLDFWLYIDWVFRFCYS